MNRNPILEAFDFVEEDINKRRTLSKREDEFVRNLKHCLFIETNRDYGIKQDIRVLIRLMLQEVEAIVDEKLKAKNGTPTTKTP
ncbi:MAG: hypothetical protein GWN93_26805 [Deltaproteobacteria bacterium]|nr:hypothetical protein [Deltaproteobacteria bacterium]